MYLFNKYMLYIFVKYTELYKIIFFPIFPPGMPLKLF